jgi:hypothetical protein
LIKKCFDFIKGPIVAQSGISHQTNRQFKRPTSLFNAKD